MVEIKTNTFFPFAGAGLSAKSAVPSCEWLVKKYPRYSTGEYWIFDDDQEDVAEKLCNMIWDVGKEYHVKKFHAGEF